MLRHAFKEWAVICQALAEGKQAIILRKGGISEIDGEFSVEHQRFWLFPTYTHQQQSGIQEEAAPLLEKAEAERPPEGIVRLDHFAEVSGIYHVKDSWLPFMLAHMHFWSEETVRQRYIYKEPGLFVLSVRVYRSKEVFEIPNTPVYEGCRSWVELEKELPTDGATPVLADEEMREIQDSLDLLLHPTAYV